MNSPRISIVFDRRHIASNTKRAAIEIAVYFDRRSHYINTGVLCLRNEWNGRQVVRRFDMAACQKKITDLLDLISSLSYELWKDGKFSFAALKAAMARSPQLRPNLFDWWRQRIDERPLQASTKRQHLVAFDFVKSLGIIKDFEDLTPANIKLIDEAIRRENKADTTVYSYHKRIKPYLKDAVTFGFIDKCPYDDFATPHGKSARLRYLTDEERQRIERIELDNATLQHARDCFLFCCYTGLAYADASSLTPANYIRQADGIYIITARQKNKADVIIKLIDKAAAIAARYTYQMPFVNCAKYNLLLKALAARCNIDKPLSSHMARHTFATSALHHGIPIEVVSKMLAHADIQTTQIYAKVLAEDIVKGFDELNKIK